MIHSAVSTYSIPSPSDWKARLASCDLRKVKNRCLKSGQVVLLLSVTRRVVPVAPGRLVSRVGPQAGLERGGRRHPGRPPPQGLNSNRKIHLSMRMASRLRESRRVHASSESLLFSLVHTSGVLAPVPPPPPAPPTEPCPLMFLGGRKSGRSCVARAFFFRMGTPSVAPISQYVVCFPLPIRRMNFPCLLSKRT